MMAAEIKTEQKTKQVNALESASLGSTSKPEPTPKTDQQINLNQNITTKVSQNTEILPKLEKEPKNSLDNFSMTPAPDKDILTRLMNFIANLLKQIDLIIFSKFRDFFAPKAAKIVIKEEDDLSTQSFKSAELKRKKLLEELEDFEHKTDGARKE